MVQSANFLNNWHALTIMFQTISKSSLTTWSKFELVEQPSDTQWKSINVLKEDLRHCGCRVLLVLILMVVCCHCGCSVGLDRSGNHQCPQTSPLFSAHRIMILSELPSQRPDAWCSTTWCAQ
jgi:hypothetical protein